MGRALYHYAPREIDLVAEGLKTPATLVGAPHEAALLDKYRRRTAGTQGIPADQVTSKDVLKYLESRESGRGKGGSRMASFLTQPIPEKASPLLRRYAKSHQLYSLDLERALKEKLIDRAQIVEEKARSNRNVRLRRLEKELAKATVKDWETDRPLLFAERPHVFLAIKGGKLPGHVLKKEGSMRPFIAGFTAELQKLAQNDMNGESPTGVFNDPLQAANNPLTKIRPEKKLPTDKMIPAPETTPTSMQGFPR
jgi:hypothetical protein